MCTWLYRVHYLRTKTFTYRTVNTLLRVLPKTRVWKRLKTVGVTQTHD